MEIIILKRYRLIRKKMASLMVRLVMFVMLSCGVVFSTFATHVDRAYLQKGIDCYLRQKQQAFNGVLNAGSDVAVHDYIVRGAVTDSTVNDIRSFGAEVMRSLPKFGYVRIRTTAAIAERIRKVKGVRTVVERLQPNFNKINVSQGDASHQASSARDMFGVTGKGVKVGVISDSARYLSNLQESGDLPKRVTVLPGYEGYDSLNTGEGTGMMEIVYDLAPDADLYFASGWGSYFELADAIEALAAVGCKIIVDDVSYDDEPALQESYAAKAVNEFVEQGGLYFSCAINYGNKDSGTSCIWEGDFVADVELGTLTVGGVEYEVHRFGATTGDIACEIRSNDSLSDGPPNLVYLQWDDDFHQRAIDYRMVIIPPYSTALEDEDNVLGIEFPNMDGYSFVYISASKYKELTSGKCPTLAGSMVCILKPVGAERRYMRLVAQKGGLEFTTAGATWGHCAAEKAFTVASVAARSSGAFYGSEPIESSSADGPRRIFRDVNGQPLTSGFLSTDVVPLQKVDIAAADRGSSMWAKLAYNADVFPGTSAAAPHAAAIAALMLEACPTLQYEDVKDILKQSTFGAGSWNCTKGYGIINAYRAVEIAYEKGGGVPYVPSAPSLSISGTTLSWNAVSGAKYYKVYRATNPYAEPTALSSWLTSTTLPVDRPASANSVYFYYVKAASSRNDAAASAFSSERVFLAYPTWFTSGSDYEEMYCYGASSSGTKLSIHSDKGLFGAAITFTPLSNASSAFTAYVDDKAVTSSGLKVGSTTSFGSAAKTLTLTHSANTSTSPRTYGFTTSIQAQSLIGETYVHWSGRPHYFYQAGKNSVSLGATTQSVDKEGGAYTVNVEATPTTVAWTATVSDNAKDWITLYRTGSTGSGVLGYVVAENTSGVRQGTITVGGKTLTITQAGAVAITHTVRFELDSHGKRTGGGTLEQTVADGAAAIAPTVQANEGYVFDGWDKTFSSVKGDLVVTAKYSLKKYSITYTGLKDAANPTSNPNEYTIETPTITFAALSDVDGFKFTGWNPSSIAKGSTGNKTVEAQWQEVAAELPDLRFGWPSGAGWPDFVFMSATATDKVAMHSFVEGSSIYLFECVFNNGTGQSSDGFYLLRQLIKSGKVVAEKKIAIGALGGTGKGKIFSGDAVELLQGLSAGQYTYRCIIDPDGMIDETDDTNNEFDYEFTITSLPTKTYYVRAQGGSDGNDGSSASSAFASIQKAIDKASDGDMIWVDDGVYAPIRTGNKRIAIRSINGAGLTMIDAEGESRCALLGSKYGETNTVLSGFTLMNGVAYNGGGAFGGTLLDCALILNESPGNGDDGSSGLGGGSCCSVLERCCLVGNFAQVGAAAYECVLNNCLVLGNYASQYAGATCTSSLNNCTVVGNETDGQGGGCYLGEVNNCIVWGNLAESGSNAVRGAVCRYSCIDDRYVGGVGVIHDNPVFMRNAGIAEGDYSLQPNSPCVNAGCDAYVVGDTDLNDEARIYGGRVDMGAFEWQGDYPDINLVFAKDEDKGWTSPAFVTKTKGSNAAIGEFMEGDVIYLYYGVRNIASAVDAHDVKIRFTLNSNVVFEDDWRGYYISGGKLGWSGDWCPDQLQSLAPGSYTLKCKIIAAEGMIETDTTDNEFTINFVVKSEQPEVYGITYENLCGTTHNNPSTYEVGSTVVFTPPSGRTGYTFTGWTPEAITAGMTGAQTVTAGWRANTYQIVYYANGGSGTMTATDCEYDKEQTLASNQFVRVGYRFVGWADGEDAVVTQWTDGAKVTNLTSNDSGVVKLYAVWEKTGGDDPVIEPPVRPDWKGVVKEDTMVVYAVVYDKSAKATVEATGSLLAAFDANGECRGVTEIEEGPLGMIFQLSIGVESATEKGFVLKVWNAETGEIQEIGEKIDCNASKQIGEIFLPVTYEVGALTQTIELNSGWTWMSFAVLPEDATIGSVLAGGAFADGDKLKAPDKAVTYYNGSWYPATYELKPGVAYMVSKGTEGVDAFELTGSQAEDGVEVLSGWNWIGSLVLTNETVASLTHSVGFANGDQVKSGSASTTWYNGKWYPATFEIRSGAGYKAKFANAGTLYFGSASPSMPKMTLSAPAKLKAPNSAGKPTWKPVIQEDTFVAYLVISNDATKAFIESAGCTLAAFSAEGECRGVTEIEEGPLGKLYQLSVGVASATESGFTLKLWDETAKKVLDVDATLACNAEKQIGEIFEPVVLTVKTEPEQGTPFPDLGEKPSATDVQEAVKDSADPQVVANIDETNYNDFRKWVGTVRTKSGEMVGAQGVMDSPYAWLSYALDSAILIQTEPVEGDLRVDAFKPTATAGLFDFTVSVEDISVGEGAKPGNLAQVFGIEGGSTLKNLAADGVDITFGAPENGKVKFTAGPKDKTEPTFFMKVEMKP